MTLWAKSLLVALILTVCASPFGLASASAPPGVVKVRDYAKGDCSVDDTAAVQTAINAWLSQQKTRQAGLLDFGSGCYQLSYRLFFKQPDNSPVFGEIRGDGPQLATIRATTGMLVALEFDDFWYGSLHGLEVAGPNGNRNGVGIQFGAVHDGLGTCCGTLDNLQVSNFDHCYQFGFPGAGGMSPAAAELTGTELTAQFCNVGFEFYGQNTLDITLIQPHALFSLTGFRTRNTGQLMFKGGSATGNTTDFDLQSAGASFVIDGFRSESRKDVNQPSVVLGATGQRVRILSSYFDVTGNPAPVSILAKGGPMMLELVQNHLNGQVVMNGGGSGAVISRQNSIYTTAASAFNVASQSWLDSEADYKPSSLAGEWFGTWWPFTRGFR